MNGYYVGGNVPEYVEMTWGSTSHAATATEEFPAPFIRTDLRGWSDPVPVGRHRVDKDRVHLAFMLGALCGVVVSGAAAFGALLWGGAL